MREATAKGFLGQEVAKGLMPKEAALGTLDFNDAKAQDIIRLFLFRVIEEFVESLQAKSIEHRLEELIDTLFFLLEIPILDTWRAIPQEKLALELSTHNTPGYNTIEQPLAIISYAAGMFADKLRNRSWMVNVQDVYVAGSREMLSMINSIFFIITGFFNDWEEFWRYYVAKDRVLQFRLRSGY